MLPYAFFLIMLLLTFPLMYFNIFPYGHYEVIFKTLCSLSFVCCSFCSYRKSNSNKKYFIFIFLGLIFGLFGDVFLALTGNTVFLLGVCSFALGHIFFISGFIYLTSITIKDLVLYIIFLTLAIGFIKLKSGFDFKGMLPLVLIYTSIITFMITKALSLLKIRKENKFATYLTILGSILFFISDFVLLFVLFYKDYPAILIHINTIVYYLGQGLLGLSFIKGFKKVGKPPLIEN